MKKPLLFILLLFSTQIFSQKYVCFENDKNNTIRINVKFDNNENPISVKYLGQNKDIQLKFKKKEIEKNGGVPAYYVFRIYDEIINGKKNGTYTFSNIGNHGLDVTYKRKDNKEFYFQIIENMEEQQGEIFRKKSCF